MKIAENYYPNRRIYYDVKSTLASIHSYVNYSVIQVLMMVTNIETFNVDCTS